jgi:hypothetical protein
MKKILALTLLLSATACDNYETLRDQVKYRSDKAFDFIGANVTQKLGVTPQSNTSDVKNQIPQDKKQEEDLKPVPNAYEITVNAPAGTSMNSAMDMFKAEAKKVCGSDNFSQKITQTGTDTIREFGMKNVKEVQIPQIKGVITCN